ncbi:MAG: PAS domain S-box protein [Deltaproteobacteria bacterium]|nr:PAS domain S-box protein [Deltaproteobacteria bacterium]
METEPTYEELEQRVKELEEEAERHKLAEETLRDSEEQFRIFFNCCPMGIFVYKLDQDGNLIFQNANQAADDILGVNCRHFLGKTLEDAFPPLADTEIPARYKEAATEGKIWETEQIDYTHGEISGAFKVVAFQTKLNEMACIFEDITQRKSTEDALRESEERFRETVELLPTIVCEYDTNGRFTYVNTYGLDTLDYTFTDLKNGLYATEVFPSEEITKFKDRFNLLLKGEKITSTEYRVRCKDGSIIDVIANSSPVYKDEKIVGGRSSVTPITERKQIEEALRKSEERFRELAELLPETIFEVDATGNITFVNRKAFEHFRYTQRDFDQGLNSLDMIVPEDRHRAMENITKILRGKNIGLSEYQALRKDGTTFPAMFHSTPMIRDGNPVGLRGFIIDISEKKRLEAQLLQSQKMEAIGTLAGGIAHDFNNILSPIMTHTEMALMDVLEDSPVRFSLREVLKASKRARDLVKQILAFSRQTEHESVPLKLGFIIKEALKLLRSSIPTTIEIQQKIMTGSDAILADPTQMHQVIMNLCTNAFHAMREKGGLLEVSLTDEYVDPESANQFDNLRPGSYLKLSVRDTGQGMEPDVIEKIFEPYFTTRDKGVGTGLGMAVVLGIVQDHGGSIHVQSELGKGSTFDMFLPKIDFDIAEKIEPREQIPSGNERILLVDDEVALIDAERQMLMRLGYEVVSRTSSIEALELFRVKADQFDMIITDMTMPNMTGVELAHEVKKIRPDIPIILCTGFSELINEEKAKKMGIKAFVMKPIVMREIGATIRKVMDKEKKR